MTDIPLYPTPTNPVFFQPPDLLNDSDDQITEKFSMSRGRKRAMAEPDWDVMQNIIDRIEESPETITLEEIENQNNIELRRLLIKGYGANRFAVSGELISEGEDSLGKPVRLYRRDTSPYDEAVLYLHVVNSTEEPDGTFKDYYLRVPPTFADAMEALAWTWGLKKEDYLPRVET